uniref:Uncharacterized protein n=1 Tax=Paramoeba aestuarina TaxID=180227 RepID=A0A7S4NMS5_9EUKA|mmetsp:Transcript_20488/g.32000  ORF Transcript_20488/g.32000 Transcript_20488/m.32000 type:complete len:261 (+) Transcript_20488:41-823(+)
MLKTIANNVRHTFAISGAPIKAKKGWFQPPGLPSKWVTKKQISSMKLRVKPSAKPVKLKLDDPKASASFDCYRIEDIVEEKALKKAIAHRHISAYTGNPYRAVALYTLIRSSLDRNYNSGLWSTKNRLEQQGIDIKPNETPTVISLPNKDTVELYNADQTMDPKKVRKIREEADKMIQISAKTGREFHGDLNRTLSEALKNQPLYNNIWLTRKQADQIGVNIDSCEPSVDVKVDNKTVAFFNCMQTNEPYRVKKHVRALR